MTTIMRPRHCDLQPQIQETHRTTHTDTTTVAEHRGGTNSRQKRPQPQPPHTQGTIAGCNHFTRKTCKLSCSGFLPKTKPIEHSCSHYNAFCSITWLTRISLRTWQHQMTTIIQPFQCDLQPQIQKTNRTTHTGTTTRCRTQRRNTFATETTAAATAAHTRYDRRLQPLYTEKMQAFVLRLSPQNKAHWAFMQPLQCILQHSLHHFPSSPLPVLTTSLRHHFPSSPSLPHHFPSSPLPFVTTFLRHHFPSSPLPFITTSLPHHFPSSPLLFLTTSLPHHFPSSPLSFVTTSHCHHIPSSPLPFLTTSLRHHFPSSPLPFLTTSLRHHFPSSPLPFVTISLGHHCPSSPPCVIASYSFVVYCYVM